MDDTLETLKDGNARVIVVQALTRDLSKLSTEEILTKTNAIIEKAKLKADKVVVSSIINREDEEQLSAKADIVNGNLKFSYARDEKVVVCDNGNLYDPKFRYDKLHLTNHGVALFATNMKYKIAEALGIEVKKKVKNQQRDRDRDNYDNYSNNYQRGDRDSYNNNSNNNSNYRSRDWNRDENYRREYRYSGNHH